ncbi:MAG: hypothetical protein ACRYGL_17635, partial [Janthinobacterium lividum]
MSNDARDGSPTFLVWLLPVGALAVWRGTGEACLAALLATVAGVVFDIPLLDSGQQPVFAPADRGHPFAHHGGLAHPLLGLAAVNARGEPLDAAPGLYLPSGERVDPLAYRHMDGISPFNQGRLAVFPLLRVADRTMHPVQLSV